MPKTAQIFSDNGHQAVRLPDDIHFAMPQVDIRQDEQTGDVILSGATTPRAADFEKLFQLLEELGPAPDEFMLNVCDPLLETEDIFGPEESW